MFHITKPNQTMPDNYKVCVRMEMKNNINQKQKGIYRSSGEMPGIKTDSDFFFRCFVFVFCFFPTFNFFFSLFHRNR